MKRFNKPLIIIILLITSAYLGFYLGDKVKKQINQVGQFDNLPKLLWGAKEVKELRTDTTATFEVIPGKKYAAVSMVKKEETQSFSQLFWNQLTRAIYSVFATVSGPNSPIAVQNVPHLGAGVWCSPEQAIISDNLHAITCEFDQWGGADWTDYIQATSFGFSIPAGAIIDGIVVDWEKSVNQGPAYDQDVYVVKNGSIAGIDKAKATPWPLSDAYSSYGSPTDLWGTTWTADDINNTGFGAILSAFLPEVGSFPPPIEFKIDHVRITVYYTEGTTPNRCAFY